MAEGGDGGNGVRDGKSRKDRFTEESLAIVYIPTAPNPTSGNMALVAEDDLFETDMPVEDAMKLVFSGGIATPDAITLARMPIEYRVRSNYTGRFDRDSLGLKDASTTQNQAP